MQDEANRRHDLEYSYATVFSIFCVLNSRYMDSTETICQMLRSALMEMRAAHGNMEWALIPDECASEEKVKPETLVSKKRRAVDLGI